MDYRTPETPLGFCRSGLFFRPTVTLTAKLTRVTLTAVGRTASLASTITVKYFVMIIFRLYQQLLYDSNIWRNYILYGYLFVFAGKGLGLPNLKPYLGLGLDILSSSYDGVVFSVDGSTILSNEECSLLGLNLSPSNIPLNTQLDWFRQAIKPPLICLNPQG